MKKFLSILLTLALVIGVFPPVAKAQFMPEEFRQHLNQYVKEEFCTKDFFPPSIEGGHRFGAFRFDTLSDSSQFKLDIKLPEDILIPNYGEPFDYTQRFGIQRYLGYTPQGHPNSNPVHPFDEWAGGILETRNWISEPWGDDGVQQRIASQLGVSTDEIRDSFPKEMSMGIRDIPQIREKILYGLEFSKYNGQLIYDNTNSPGKGINYPWEEKIMVYYPPTDESWGLGLMWQYAGGVLYYKDMWIPNKLPDQWWVDVLTTEPVEIPEDWREDTHLVVGKVATDEGLDNLENKAQDLTYYQDGDKVNLDFTFWNPMDDYPIAPFEYAVMYWDYSGGWDAMTGKHKENYIHTGLTNCDIFPRGNAGELDYEYDINVNQYPFELTTGKQINENSEIMEPVFGNKVNPCKNDDLFMTLAIVADPDAVFSVQSVDPEDEKWISLLTNIMIVHVPVKVDQGIDIELMLPDDYPPIILNQGESYRVPVSLMVTRNDPFETQTQPIDIDLTYTSPAGTVTKQIVIHPFPNDYYEEEINFTVSREGTYIVSGEAYPINVTDPDLSNNKDSTRIPVRIKESASKTDADDQTRVNLRS